MAVDGDPAAATRDQVLSVLSLDKGSCSRRLGASALALTKGLPRTCAGGAVRDQPRLRRRGSGQEKRQAMGAARGMSRHTLRPDAGKTAGEGKQGVEEG